MTNTLVRHSNRSALTLVEIMIALTMTLIVLGAMMTAFQYASLEMQNGRASIEMANRLRVAEEVLRSDLSRLMLDPRPYTDAVLPNGYFEYVEGPRRDTAYPFTAADTVIMINGVPVAGTDGFPDIDAEDVTNDGVLDNIYPDDDGDDIPDPIDASFVLGTTDLNGNGIADQFDPTGVGNNYLGDYDDMWAGTIRSDKRPFRGRYIPPTIDPATGGFLTWGVTDFHKVLTLVPATPPQATAIESPLAEVVWWTEYTDVNANFAVDFEESVRLYRRLLLIVPPDTPLPSFVGGAAALQAAIEYLACNDISARIEQTFDDVNFGTSTEVYRIVPNTVKDLANRRNRFAHNTDRVEVSGIYNPNYTSTSATGTVFSETNYPFAFNRSMMFALRSAQYTSLAGAGQAEANVDLNGDGVFIEYTGNDLMLTDVTSFDFKVYSPNALVSIQPTEQIIVEPSDVGFISADPAILTPIGAFVDLGHGGGGWFNRLPDSKSKLAVQYRFETTATVGATSSGSGHGGRGNGGAIGAALAGLVDLAYDTWTPIYESDGINQDNDVVASGDALIDEGTNGIDNQVVENDPTAEPAAPDDSSELETSPPYPHPVRGVKVSIRLIEKTTKQIHQSTIIQSYVPE